VLGFVATLVDKKEHEARGEEGHAKQNVESNVEAKCVLALCDGCFDLDKNSSRRDARQRIGQTRERGSGLLRV
jgi:hypothetical protein